MQMAVTDKGNLDHVRSALTGITGIEPPPAPVPSGEWCLILVRPGFELEARDSLRRRGIGAWWPNFQKEVGAKDRETGKRYKRIVMAPVLPGVLLSPARFSAMFWQAIDLAPGVMNVLFGVDRNGNKSVVLLTDLDIATLHAIERGLQEMPEAKSKHSFEVGNVVRLLADEFRRLPPARVIECLQNGNLMVEVNLFGGLTPMEVLPRQIELIDSGPKNQSTSKATDARDRPAKSPRKRR